MVQVSKKECSNIIATHEMGKEDPKASTPVEQASIKV